MSCPGSPIPDPDNVARWCRHGRHVDTETGDIKNEAFYLRPSEEYLSANWIEYYAQDHETAVNIIRDAIPVSVSRSDKFVVLNVSDIIDSIREGGGESPSVVFCPECNNPSHVAIAWDDMVQNQQMVASELLTLITSQNTYPRRIL